MKMLVQARCDYDWPAGRGAVESQQTILNLEANIAQLMQGLDEENAHRIVLAVSAWAGNNARSHDDIVQATPADKVQMLSSLQLFNTPDGLANAMDALCLLPGIRLVIASKIFRFCCPAMGAAVDRHTSYFFNSLGATNFRREWSNGKHRASRLAIYQSAPYTRNRREFVTVYLPMLRSMANALNAIPVPYHCAATGEQKKWRLTDVEMAAYYWGACNAPR
ncbi:MAG: hypothetical protein PHU44_08130 [Syntrophales bacterium]|nr:hypothetical protein [Syntrophales bacterium]